VPNIVNGIMTSCIRAVTGWSLSSENPAGRTLRMCLDTFEDLEPRPQRRWRYDRGRRDDLSWWGSGVTSRIGWCANVLRLVNAGVTDRVAASAAIVAAVLGLASAGVSAYWAVGGTGLLDTIGGSIERWGRERATAVVVVLWFIVALKIVVALAAPILSGIGSNRLPAWTTARIPRALGWIAAATLTVYGGVWTIAGLLAQTGAVEASADTDQKALAWHAYLWDPWFAVWGVAFVVALWLSRRGAIQQR
jgi:hypothetical protein